MISIFTLVIYVAYNFEIIVIGIQFMKYNISVYANFIT